MGLLVSTEILTFECERDRCGNQSSHYKYGNSTKFEDILSDVESAAEIAIKEGWLIVSTSYSICPKHFQETLKEIREVGLECH